MEIRTIRTPGLGDATYVLAHEGVGIVVDPQRDIGRFVVAVAELDVEVRWVLETHVHNDYVSGGRALAARTRADLVVPAPAAVPYPHRPAFHGEDLVEGSLAVRPIHTPGHTPEHTSYLVVIDEEPMAVFSGGSLLVGSTGRCDLLGPSRAVGLARAQYRSVRRLARLPDAVELLPTHGEGSFCTASVAGRSTSTIGLEKAHNTALACPDVDTYVDAALSGLEPYPSYYAQMGAINLAGPTPLPAVDVPRLTLDAIDALGDDVAVVDVRSPAAFAAGHLDGSTSVPLTEAFAVWVAWTQPFNARLVLVADDDDDTGEAVVQLGRVGFDRVRGTVAIDDWVGAKRRVRGYRAVNVGDVVDAVRTGEAQVLDVRAPSEWDAGHVEGSLHRYLPDIAQRGVPKALVQDRPVWTLCGSGMRATIAAGFLERCGHTPVVLVESGVPDVLAALADPSV